MQVQYLKLMCEALQFVFDVQSVLSCLFGQQFEPLVSARDKN